ncbi:MAG: M24 family metallopeptidase [Gemmatimonadota bacterium]|nr:M24 family metallopeptidase [Gemmatimonadota bacterium]
MLRKRGTFTWSVIMVCIRNVLAGLFLSLTAASFSWAGILPNEGRDLVPPAVFRSMQNYMLEKRFDGWLFSGSGHFDDPEREFLGLEGKTRYRWFIFYPAIATHKYPWLIYHKADEHVFSGLRFYPLPYRSRSEMLRLFRESLFPVARKICANYSSEMSIPGLSSADSGMLEWLEANGVEVISSGSILSFFNTRWRVSDIETHSQAAARLDSILPEAVSYLEGRIRRGRKVTDYGLAKFLRKGLKKLGLEPVARPVVAAGPRTLEERWKPESHSWLDAEPLAYGDIVYIELSARLRKRAGSSRPMHARLGWSLYIGEEVPDSLTESWERITAAADKAIHTLGFYIPKGLVLHGFQVDSKARAELGRGPDILPRPLGFNLNPHSHRFGVRFDNYYAKDDREIMPGMGFTLEPGIFRENYALRMCANVVIDGSRGVRVFPASSQSRLIPVLGPAESGPCEEGLLAVFMRYVREFFI